MPLPGPSAGRPGDDVRGIAQTADPRGEFGYGQRGQHRTPICSSNLLLSRSQHTAARTTAGGGRKFLIDRGMNVRI